MLDDQQQRQRALETGQSFIVQSPAGSGKTELLTQRVLKLLALVSTPEEVLALTFTRKAAFEMRNRILSALRRAANEPKPLAAHEQLTWKLAQHVLEKDQTKQWHLLENPHRLAIQTIDALCANLTRQMPLLSQFGANFEVSQDPLPHYEEAAKRTIGHLISKSQWSNDIQCLLMHLDNQIYRLVDLLQMMLSNRDQWLSLIIKAKSREDLRECCEVALQDVIQETLQQINKHFPVEYTQELTQLLHFASENLLAEDSSSLITACHGVTALPGAQLEDIALWHGISELLLTKDSQWRKSITKAIGFPAKSSVSNKEEKERLEHYKIRCQELLAALSHHEDFKHHLARLKHCPTPHYSDAQWDIVAALLEILPLLVAELKIVFQQQSCVDFIEISQAAAMALGENENPTDLALYFDHRLQHILIDEFQDTSISQFQLFEKLLAGWQSDDGRTLFIVGDPMQSIYRFREAEVALFSQVQAHGIAGLHPESLHLSQNFRSDKRVIDWVNTVFSSAFPDEVDNSVGAIPYKASSATQEFDAQCGVEFHACDDLHSEAIHTVKLIENIQKQHPEDSIAILVRSRHHLSDILSVLQLKNINYQAIEIDHLASNMVIQDLSSLTRALLHPADRLAWFSILRAPWCGLSLNDLYYLSSSQNEKQDSTIWGNLKRYQAIAEISKKGKQQLARIHPVLNHAMENRARQSLVSLLESTWLALGGPACLASENDLVYVKRYWELLGQHEKENSLENFDLFNEQVNKLYIENENETQTSLQIMTMHKSKGLEFDHVILPSLARGTRSSNTPLLRFAQVSKNEMGSDLIFAPIMPFSQKSEPINEYLKQHENEKNVLESARLLYVAATRARKQLHCLSCFTVNDENELMPPIKSSLLARIWPQIEETVTKQAIITETEVVTDNEKADLHRLKENWKNPIPIKQLLTNKTGCNPLDKQSTRWHPDNEKLIGTLIHRYLRIIVLEGTATWNARKLKQMKPVWKQALTQLGLAISDLDASCDIIASALKNMLADQRGKWILDANYSFSECEYAITTHLDNQTQHVIIDRLFIDDTGSCWIIDYKTSQPQEDQSQATFIQSQHALYQKQLENYACAISQWHKGPIHCALYFPQVAYWHEWQYNTQQTEVHYAD